MWELESECAEIMEECGQIKSKLRDLFERLMITETKLTIVGKLLAEEKYGIELTSQLGKSPMMSTGSVEEHRSAMPAQQNETRRSQDCKPVSLGGRLHNYGRQFCTSVSSYLTNKREAEERKSFVPESTGSHQFYSRQYSPQDSYKSVKREMSDTNGLPNMMKSATQFNKPTEAQRSDKPAETQRSDKPAETQRSDKPAETPLRKNCALIFGNLQGNSRSDKNQAFADCKIQDGASSNAMSCKPEETQESEAERKLVADQLHPSMSSQPQETDTGGNRQRQMSDTSHCASSGPPPFSKPGGSAVADQRRHFASSFFRRVGGLPLLFLLFAVGVCTVAGNLCDKKREILAVQKGEVALVCPVTADVYQTKQSVIISFVNNHTHEEVLGCDWLTKLNKFDCLKSDCGAELIEIQADLVLARLPEDGVQQNGSYRAQMIPNDPAQPFTYCNFCYPVVPKDTSTTEVPTTVDHHMRESQKDTGGDEELTTTTLLLCIVLFLLVVLVVMVTFQLRNRGVCRITLHSCYVKKSPSGTPVHECSQTGPVYKLAAQDDNLMISGYQEKTF